MNRFTDFLNYARKALLAAVNIAGELLTLGLLHGTIEHVVAVAIPIVTTVLVYWVKNIPLPFPSPTPPPPAA